MYCPQCGDHNETQQGFCRQCGLSLVSVRLAVQGRVDEVMTKFGKAEDLVAGGLLTFSIFFIGAIISLVLGGTAPFAISLVIGLLICLPIVITGLVRVDRLRRLLDPKNMSSDRLLKDAGPPVGELAAVRSTDPLADNLPVPNSITENTTLNLKTPGGDTETERHGDTENRSPRPRVSPSPRQSTR